MAIDESGHPVFLAQGGSGNLVSTPEATLDRSLRRALEGVPAVDVVCACFAGLLTEPQRDQALERLRPLLPGARIRVCPDYHAALRACPPETGACVIAGTGSIVCSRFGGTVVKSGGRGYLLGDEGSGFRYGLASLRHYVRNVPNVSANLAGAVQSLFDVADPELVTRSVYSAASPAGLIAGLASAFARDAQNREEYATLALAQESAELAQIVADHFLRYPSVAEIVVGLAGGLWRRSVFRVAFADALQERVPGSRVVKSEMPPVRGAALLALEEGA